MSVYDQPSPTYRVPLDGITSVNGGTVAIRAAADKTVAIVGLQLQAAVAVLATERRYTEAESGGTPVVVTPSKVDSLDDAASATVNRYSAAPTLNGTATSFGQVSLIASLNPVERKFTNDGGKPITLKKGSTETYVLVFSGAQTIYGYIEFIEY